jgi:hypothetical protein
LWGRGISARFQGATNTGPCATRETRRDSRGNDLVGLLGWTLMSSFVLLLQRTLYNNKQPPLTLTACFPAV